MPEKKSLRLLNVKVTEDLRSMIVRATELSGMRSMSEWMREALEAGAQQEIAAADRATSGLDRRTRMTTANGQGAATRHLGMHMEVARCVHPTPAREQTPEAEICGLCGAVTRWRV